MIVRFHARVDRVAKLADDPGQQAGTRQQVERMQQRRAQVAVLGMQPAGGDLDDRGGVDAVQRGHGKQALRHLAIGAQLVLELQHDGGRGADGNAAGQDGDCRAHADPLQHRGRQAPGQQAFKSTGE